MKLKFLSLFLLLNILYQYVSAQTIYQFQYNVQLEGRSVPVNALLFQYEDGSGFLRERFDDQVSQTVSLVESKLDEVYLIDENGQAKTDSLYIKAIVPELILGSKATLQIPRIFLFVANKANGEVEPKCRVEERSEGVLVPMLDDKFSARFVSANEISQTYFGNYFQSGDPFYESYFELNTKNITEAEKNRTMYLIVVANTLDSSIGNSCKLDTARIVRVFSQISAYIGSKLRIQTYCGQAFGKQQIVSAIKVLKPSEKDIVVFYYTGHGFRRTTDSSRFPNMDLRFKHEQDYNKESLNIQYVYDQLRKKKANLTLVLGDCCNSHIDAPRVNASLPPKKKLIVSDWNSKNIRELFLVNRRTSILATAADRTQMATSNNALGGFFSYYFKVSLDVNCKENQVAPNWRKILDEASKQTYIKALNTYCFKPFIPSNICNQYPCYKIDY